MSPRMVHFTNTQLIWQCQRYIETEMVNVLTESGWVRRHSKDRPSWARSSKCVMAAVCGEIPEFGAHVRRRSIASYRSDSRER